MAQNRTFRNEQRKKRSQLLAQITSLMIDGHSQKKCAEILKVSKTSVCKLLGSAPKVKEKIRAYRAGEIDNPFKMDDSLSAYHANIRIEFPELYEANKPGITWFRRRFSKL